MNKFRKRKQQGFTLIELMAVIVIIGILIAVVVPNFAAMQMRAKISSVKSNARTIQVMAESFNIDHQYYPSSVSDFTDHDSYKEFSNPITLEKGVGIWDGAWTTFPGSFFMSSLSWSAARGKALYMGYDAENNPTINFSGSNVAGRQSDHYRIIIMNENGRSISNFEISS